MHKYQLVGVRNNQVNAPLLRIKYFFPCSIYSHNVISIGQGGQIIPYNATLDFSHQPIVQYRLGRTHSEYNHHHNPYP